MRLLYSNESTSKEMLVIEAPRNLMFEPDSFLFALAHEIAHYVGRHHRLLDGSEKPRNTMLYELHEEEFVEKCKEGLCLALEESFDYTTATRISNLFKEKIEAENSNYKRRIKKNASPPDEKASFTEMEKYIFENYTNPLLRRPAGHTPVFHKMQPACPRFLSDSSQQLRSPYQNIRND